VRSNTILVRKDRIDGRKETELYNTEIAVKGLRVKIPDAPAAETATVCTCCGRPIPKGAPAFNKLPVSDAFMDDAWLAARSGAVCPYCYAMTSTAVTKALGSCNCLVYTLDGAFPISTDVYRAWFLQNPPEPPFVVTASKTSKYQHVVWKAPVTLSHEMIFVAWPTQILTIRHSVLMEAVSVCELAMEEFSKLKEGEKPQKGKKAKEENRKSKELGTLLYALKEKSQTLRTD